MELGDWVPFSNRGVMDTFDRSFTSHKPSITVGIFQLVTVDDTGSGWNPIWIGYSVD